MKCLYLKYKTAPSFLILRTSLKLEFFNVYWGTDARMRDGTLAEIDLFAWCCSLMMLLSFLVMWEEKC